ncbi:2-dehydro-3-deoxygluconokinase [Anaerocolumna cellulosilytica]|uniref:2-dehydro-3-deoxygluconokinase n=1 Tax=Anaerocolumna cellulosilytica TaxID=433286 RepID=A0A6S6RBE2_9FIRM|nr:sugar kinase [Anaerocolumna cellulosilytica]MBB5195810.1 2-dehydro-3-deoxygluconokinase [Anaerocolumna cellulosilytica]BCJ96820.1 2-dehydro-3-deoxygluconokinase [Anaerocolumna cellulosilytica]
MIFSNEKKDFDALAFGEILLRLSSPVNERITTGAVFEKRAGGAELNVVSGISLMGLRTGIISKLPKNELGTYLKNNIRFCGVSDDWLIYDESKEARLGIYYYEHGVYPRKPTVVYDRKNASVNTIKPEDIPEDIYSSTRLFHTSGISLALSEQTRSTSENMIKKFKAAGALISFDVNFRANLWSEEEAKAKIESILPYVDILFVSEETARRTFGKEGSLTDILKEFAKEYDIEVLASTERKIISPKKHTFGSTIYCKSEDKFYKEAPYENIEVVDRIGSGDAYVSGVLYGLLEYGDCQKALEYGNAASAVKNTILGDLPSTDKKEIDRIIDGHKNTGYQSEMNR